MATALALAVTYPQAGNIGGGGFMLVWPGGGQEPVCVDYREPAPADASPDMFVADRAPYSHKAVGVPGTLRGLELAHRRWGKLAWHDLVAPAVTLAAQGFTIDKNLAEDLNETAAKSTTSGDFVACSPQRVTAHGKPAIGWCSRSLLAQCDLWPTTGLTHFITVTSPSRLLPRCAPAAD